MIILTITIQASKKNYIQKRQSADKKKSFSGKCVSVFSDVFDFHKNLISPDTLKVAAITIPSFFIARFADDSVHECFYNRLNHKNINQMPHWSHEVARVITGPTITFLALQGFLSKRSRDFYTAYAMVLGFPFLWFTNEFIKKIKIDCSLRPWNQYFSSKKRASGGFPSGHTAKIAYLATLYGLEYGLKAAIPLGLIAMGIGGTFIASNRHYTSQIIAGFGAGIVYGIAAHKLVHLKESRYLDLTMNIAFNQQSGPTLNLYWKF